MRRMGADLRAAAEKLFDTQQAPWWSAPPKKVQVKKKGSIALLRRRTRLRLSETFAQASGLGGGIGFGFAINTASASQRLRHITKSVPVQNVAPPCRGGLPAPPHGGGQGPTSSRVPERSARPSLPPFPPLFCASASVCGCPLSPPTRRQGPSWMASSTGSGSNEYGRLLQHHRWSMGILEGRIHHS